MFSTLNNLKARMFRPPVLVEGSEFSLATPSGKFADDEARWRVAAVRMLRGIPHALIEQLTTGETKTMAVSAILSDPAFHTIPPAAARG